MVEQRRPGRPKGSRNKHTVALDPLIEQRNGVSPGRGLLEVMWYHYSEAAAVQNDAVLSKTKEGKKTIEHHLEQVRLAARDAAPYIHTRLASVVVTGDDDGNPIQHHHTGLVGVAALSADDLKRLSDSELTQLLRGEISSPIVLPAEPGSDTGGT